MDWSLPNGLLHAFDVLVGYLKNRDEDLARWCDPATITGGVITNPINGQVRFLSSSRKWQRYNSGSGTWVDLSPDYAISITGNAATATKLATGRTISLTGHVSGTSSAFDGTANVSISVTIGNNVVSNAMLRDSVGVSVIGRSANSTGDPADIVAGADDRILARVSGSLQWVQLNANMIPSSLITYAKIQNVSATNKLLGRASAGAGVIEEITCTAFARSLLDDNDAATARSTLGLGSVATQNANDMSITVRNPDNVAQTLTPANPIAWNMNNGGIASITLNGSYPMGTPTNIKKGTYVLFIYQDATGNRDITSWPSVFKFAAGVPPVITKTPNALTVLTFISDGTTLVGAALQDVKAAA